MSDQVPDPVAALDQMLRGMVDVGRALYGYYGALVQAGFNDTQALALTVNYQSLIHQQATGGTDG